MEADWEIEIGPDAPVIDAAWEGFVELRGAPERVTEIVETTQLPGLSDTLIRLNSPSSPVWTAKCDVWRVAEFDPYEMDADPQSAASAMACYIDLVPAEASTLDTIQAWCKRLCLRLEALPAPRCRVDAIVRRAVLTPDTDGLAVTVYVTACGRSSIEATVVLSGALTALADSALASGTPSPQPSKYNQDNVGE